MLWTSYWKSICFVQIIRKIAYSPNQFSYDEHDWKK